MAALHATGPTVATLPPDTSSAPSASGRDADSEETRADQPDGLEDMLDRIVELTDDAERVAFGDVIEAIGAHAFGPVILFIGLLLVVPGVGDIPGVPVLSGIFLIVVGVQHLMRRDEIWIPGWLKRRSVKAGLVEKSVRWMRKPARFVDRRTRPRLTWAVRHAGYTVIAVSCLVIAAATPLMEVVPFSAALAGTVLTAYGIGLLARDGLVALVAMALAIGTIGFIGWQLAG